MPESYPLTASNFRTDNNGNKFVRVKGVRWFTNLDIPKKHEELILYKKYNSEEYPKYIDYDAINVDSTSDIPLNYNGLMGVPISFLDKYNPDQFEILGIAEPSIEVEILSRNPDFKAYKSRQKYFEGKLCQKKYHRLFIKHKNKKVVK